jgi:DNA polymerase II large subunit
MKEKIKELRVQIDGLSQLVKELKSGKQFLIDVSKLPNAASLEEVIEVFEKTGYDAVDHGKEFITSLPQEFKEIEKAYDSLILAKAWLGKILGKLEAESPYPKDGTRKTVDDIEPTADVNNEVPFGDRVGETLFRDKNRIEKVDWLRQEIQKIVNITDPYREYENNLIWENMSTVGMAYLFNANRHLSEARFWLGFELQRIRESS